MEVVKNIIMKRIPEVRPYVRNPRKNDKTVQLLVDIIPKVGFNVPIVIDKKNVIVKGHARYAAAIKLGMQEVPCVITDADEETIKLDRLADNKISEFSEWLNEDLMHEVDMINLDFDFDFEALGLPVPFEDFDIPNVYEDDETPAAETEDEKRARYAAYLENEAKKEAKNGVIVTEAQLEKAKTAAAQVPMKPPKYFKVACEHCGHIMFIKEGDAVFVPE